MTAVAASVARGSPMDSRRPLDEGDFDLSPLLARLDEIGYRSPVGPMCCGVPGDAHEHLSRSIKAWRGLRGIPAAREP
jgi:hypothetical protein